MMTDVENKSIESINKFIDADDNIKQLVADLEMYYQFNNQSTVELFEKWKKPVIENGKVIYFSGNFWDYVKLQDMKELFKLSDGKIWQSLISSIFLIDNYVSKINMEGFYKLNKEHQIEVMNIISKGQLAYDRLVDWLKPINKKNVLTAIYEAIKISFNEDRYSMFQIVKFGKLESVSDGKVTIHENIIEINNPTALVEYFKSTNKPIHDSLVLTFMRHPKYDYKPMVYLFFIFNSELYVIDFSERRLNIGNTAGERSGGRRFYEAMEKIWLPWDLILDDDKPSKQRQVELKEKNYHIRGNLLDVFKTAPEIKAWMEMFVFRIIDYIQSNGKKIELGVTTLDVARQLEDKREKEIPLSVKVYDSYRSFESHGDAGSYLLKKYSESITSLVPVGSDLPMLIGKRDFVEGVVKYKQRTVVADTLQMLIYKDWKKNHKNVYGWMKKFVMKQNPILFVKRALEDNEYSFMRHRTDFSEKRQEPNIGKAKIMRVFDYMESHYWISDDDDTQIVFSKTGKLWDWELRKHVNCVTCNKFQHTMRILLKFIDYRQICEFFEIDENILPVEYKQHLHQQNETDVGNSILDDTDPIDELKDFWFRRVYKKEKFWDSMKVFKPFDYNWADGGARIEITIPICRKCLKKLGYTKEMNKQ